MPRSGQLVQPTLQQAITPTAEREGNPNHKAAHFAEGRSECVLVVPYARAHNNYRWWE
jgi:hypothetical protein